MGVSMKILLTSVAMASLLVTSSHAAVTSFTSLADFEAAATVNEFEDFENVSGRPLPSPLVIGSASLFATGPGSEMLWQSGENPGSFPLPGFYVGAENAQGGIGIDLAPGISAIAFDLGEILETPSEMEVRVTDGGGTSVFQLNVGGGTGFTFRGFTSDSSITNVVIEVIRGGSFEALDNLRVGVAGDQRVVPLPAAAPLMLAGLAALGLRSRRRPS